MDADAMSNREHEVRLPDRFWRHCTHLSPGSKVMYCILLTFIDYNTCETIVGNLRLQRESGFGAVKVKGLLAELEAAKYIERHYRYAGNLRSERTIRCLKFTSTVQISYSRPDGMVSDRPKTIPISLPSHSSEPSQSHKSNSSEPLPAPETLPERIM